MGGAFDINALGQRVTNAARRRGWDVILFGDQAGLPLLCLMSPGAADASRRVYVSTGIHGDEPAGPLAVAQLLEAGWEADGAGLFVFPALNPDGLRVGSRTNRHGVDLNRDYRESATAEVQAHLTVLRTLPRLDRAVLLHEDWETSGCYLYEINPRGVPVLGPVTLAAMAAHLPVETAPEVDGRPLVNGIVCNPNPLPDRPDWPEAFYLARHLCDWAVNLETPSSRPLEDRVAAQAAGLMAAAVHPV